MIVLEIFFAIIIALVFSLFLGGLLGWQLPGRGGLWTSLAFLFFLIFITTFAGGYWLRPIGPPLWGVYWAPILLIGFIVMLLAAVIIPPRRPRNTREAIRQAAESAEAEWSLGIFFWLLLLIFGIAIIARFM